MGNALSAVSIKIDDDTKTRLTGLADARNRTSHWLMRAAILQLVACEEKREALRHEINE